MNLEVSLIIPVYNECRTIATLINSIKEQSVQPQEVILVDGGSTDNTLQIANNLITDTGYFRIIEAERVMPGTGRNIGAKNAISLWIAFTDAGIKLDKYWMEKLIEKVKENPSIDIVYGNVSPQINQFFDKCAAIAYVSPLRPGRIRTKSIASCLLKKEVWEKSGGFPDWRATEDLVFMENAEKTGFKSIEAPEAMVYWELRPDLKSTFKKFKLYSAYNVWANRQAYWHYGVARQYILMLIFVLLGFFHTYYWLLFLPAWIAARVVKRMWSNRYEFGLKMLFNFTVFLMTIIITLVIDAATFSGWLKALFGKKSFRKSSLQH